MADLDNGLPPIDVDLKDVKIQNITISTDELNPVGVNSIVYDADDHIVENKHPQISSICYATTEIKRPNYMTFI